MFSVSSREICEAVDYKGELRCPLGLPTGEALKTYCTSLRSEQMDFSAKGEPWDSDFTLQRFRA